MMKSLYPIKLIVAIAVLTLFCNPISAQQHSDSIQTANTEPHISDRSIELKEVVVMAANIIRKNDGYVLFPSKDAKRMSNDAVELIGNMQLPGIFLDNRTDNLSSIKDGNIGYRINGAPASALDFRAINPNDIRKIEYITSPGIRYGDVVAVLDIYTVRPEIGISGNLSARQSFNQGKGIYRASLKTNHRKSEFTLGTHYEYGRFSGSKMSTQSTYTFENGDILKRIREDRPYTQKEDYLQTFASYSYMDKRNLFLARLRFTQFLTPKTGKLSQVSESGTYYETEESENEIMHSKDKKPEINLYYQHEFKSKGLLIIDAVFNIMRINNDNEKYYFAEDKTENSVWTYGFGEKYSTISQLQYIHPIKTGKLSIGLKHIWSKNHNEYTGTINSSSRQNRQSYSMFTEWTGNAGHLNYAVGIQGHHISYMQNDDRIREWNVQPRLRLSYDLTNNLSFTFDGNSNMFGSELGKSSSIVYKDDKYQYVAGNSALKPEKTYYGALSSSLFTRNYFGDLELSYEHISSPFMQDVLRENENFITTTINGKRADKLNLSHSSRIRLFNRNLSIFPRFGYRYNRWKCDSYVNRLHTWWFKGGVSYSLKNFYFSIDYYKNADLLNYGFGKRTTQQTLLFGVSYRVNSLKFLANVSQPLNDYVFTINSNSEYTSAIKTFYQRGRTPILSVQVSWNFAKNNKNPHKEKRIDNEDNDNGML